LVWIKISRIQFSPRHTPSQHRGRHRAGRDADIVRYDTAGKELRYWLKHHGETCALIETPEKIVRASGKLI